MMSRLTMIRMRRWGTTLNASLMITFQGKNWIVELITMSQVAVFHIEKDTTSTTHVLCSPTSVSHSLREWSALEVEYLENLAQVSPQM